MHVRVTMVTLNSEVQDCNQEILQLVVHDNHELIPTRHMHSSATSETIGNQRDTSPQMSTVEEGGRWVQRNRKRTALSRSHPFLADPAPRNSCSDQTPVPT